MRSLLSLLFTFLFLYAGPVYSQTCASEDRACILKELQQTAALIDKDLWRDQTYRELAKTLAFEGEFEQALNLIDKIESPDTQALTIRGIAMETAEREMPAASFREAIQKLREKANAIDHAPSYAIALTYIAMAQAVAKDHDGAWATAADMENAALRNKAYAETAEIQAEQGNYIAANKSIQLIDNLAFRNKAYTLVSKILADQRLYEEALQSAYAITNNYKKASALQYLLDAQSLLKNNQNE